VPGAAGSVYLITILLKYCFFKKNLTKKEENQALAEEAIRSISMEDREKALLSLPVQDSQIPS
jgi:hypothetical protein